MLLIRQLAMWIAWSCLVLSGGSCHRVRKKAEGAVHHAKEKITEKAADAGDKVFAHFDAYRSDTKFNKKRFAEFFGFWPSPDVHNLYAHADELGIDASYHLSFCCHDSTIAKIKANLRMVPDTIQMDNSNVANLSISWWDTASINSIKPLSRHLGDVYSYLWYDRKKKTAWFFSFDM